MITKTVTATEASHRRHMLATVIAFALLSVVVFMAISPRTAQAAQRWNDVLETPLHPIPFTYTREYPQSFVRTKTDSGPIRFSVDDVYSQGLCVMLLRAADGSRLALTCWLPYERAVKTMVASIGVLRFTVWAAQRGTAQHAGQYFGLGIWPSGDGIFY